MRVRHRAKVTVESTGLHEGHITAQHQAHGRGAPVSKSSRAAGSLDFSVNSRGLKTPIHVF